MLFTNCNIQPENKLRFLGKEAASDVGVRFLVVLSQSVLADASEKAEPPAWWWEGRLWEGHFCLASQRNLGELARLDRPPTVS